jgi:hypothetical protein
MKKLYKGLMKDYHDVITEWDEPNTRIFNGNEVVGRPTRGFGDSNFNYAGKYMRPEPWNSHPIVNLIKEESEAFVSVVFILQREKGSPTIQTRFQPIRTWSFLSL